MTSYFEHIHTLFGCASCFWCDQAALNVNSCCRHPSGHMRDAADENKCGNHNFGGDVVLTEMDDSWRMQLARKFAAWAHGDQKYGEKPYVVHLEAVAWKLAAHNDDPDMIIAAWLHDVLEDTEVTAETIESIFGFMVLRIVRAVTNEPGKNRKEKTEKTLPKIRSVGGAALQLKLCDRIANVRACIDGTGKSLLKMYVKERELFEQLLGREDGHYPELWKELDESYEEAIIEAKRQKELKNGSAR